MYTVHAPSVSAAPYRGLRVVPDDWPAGSLPVQQFIALQAWPGWPGGLARGGAHERR